jgi:hypothetical protein
MSDSVKVSNVAGTIRMLSIDADKIEKAAIYALSQVAFTVEREAKINASGPTRKGFASGKIEPPRHIPWSGAGPNVISGSLRRSIHTEVRRIGFGDYVATVSPTMIYARAVELGNRRWKSGVKYPYLIPAANSVRPRMNQIFMTAYMRKRQR